MNQQLPIDKIKDQRYKQSQNNESPPQIRSSKITDDHQHIAHRQFQLIDKKDRETQGHQLNFSHQDFSIQLKHNHLLSINFYEPYLQDIEWNIQFLGITSLNHVSISQYKRKRIRLVYAKINVLFFYEGHLTSKQSKYTLRNSLLKSQKTIDLNNFQIGDEILFISEDLTTNQKAGLFLICTKKNHFYAFKGNSELYELIDLNPVSGLNKIVESISKIFSQRSTFSVLGFEQDVTSYISLRKPEHKQEFFKIIVMNNLNVQVRLVSLPIVPGQKCKREIILTHTINIQTKLRQALQVTENHAVKLIHSQMHRLSEVEVVMLLLLSKSSDMDDSNCVVSLTYNFQKSEIISVNSLIIESTGTNNIELMKLPETSEIIIKEQSHDKVILRHVEIDTLKIIDDSSYPIEGPTTFCESTITSKLLILSPFQVLEINIKEETHMMDKDSHMQMVDEEQHSIVRQQRFGSITELHNNLFNYSQKLKNFHKEGKKQQMKKIISELLGETSSKIQQIAQKNRENLQIEELLSIYLTLVMYKSLLQKEDVLKGMEIGFNDLKTNNFGEISQLLQKCHKQEEKAATFVDLWIGVIQEGFKSKEWFERNEQVREVVSDLINSNFSHIINGVLQNQLILKQKESQTGEIEDIVFPNEPFDNLLLQFVKSTSGIIRIERDIYRLIINVLQNKQDLKNIVMNVSNIDALAIMYFEYGIVQGKQLESAFRTVQKQKNKGLIEKFIESFVKEFVQRIRCNDQKIHQNAKNFSNLITIFADHQQIVKSAIINSGSCLYILTALKYGQRQQIKDEIKIISQKMKKKQNIEKLRLVMMEEE